MLIVSEMNIVIILGKVIKTYKFKFIYGGNLIHKSIIKINVKSFGGEEIECIGYDDIADEILRNEFKFVCIQGSLRTEGYVEISKIIKF